MFRSFGVCFLIFFFILSNTFSQEKIDSLEEVLNSYNKNSPEYSITKFRISNRIFKTNPERGLKLANELINNFKDQKSDTIYALAHLVAAKNYFYLGDEEGLNKSFDLAFEIAKKYNHNHVLTKAYLAHRTLYSMFNISSAYYKNKEAIRFAERVKDSLFLATTYANQGILELNYKNNIDSSSVMFEKAINLYDELGQTKQVLGNTMNLGIINYKNNNYQESLNYYQKTLDYANANDEHKVAGQALENMSLTYQSMKMVDTAIVLIHKATERYIKAEDSISYGKAILGLSNIYIIEAKYKEAYEFAFKALEVFDNIPKSEKYKFDVYEKLFNLSGHLNRMEDKRRYAYKQLEQAEKMNSKLDIAVAKYNIAKHLTLVKDSLDYAEQLLNSVLNVYKEEGLSKRIDEMNIAFGNLYFIKEKFTKAKKYYLESIAYLENKKTKSTEDKRIYSGALNNLGIIEYELQNYNNAINYYRASLDIRLEVNNRRGVLDSYETLRNIYAIKDDFKNAYKYSLKYSSLKDSIFKDDLARGLEEAREKYETEKKEKENKILSRDNKIKDLEIDQVNLENQRNRTLFISSAGVAGLILVLSFIVYSGYKRKQKDNKLLKLKNDEISDKNKEILDSITYAKRLQDAILPSEKIVKSFLMDSFILYKPKDIVAGDFYYMDVVEEGGKKLIYYVAADCTGHGVPGAMVSIVGANGLKRCIQEFDLRVPGEILDRLAEIVAENFALSEERIRDGMDLALCCLEIENEEIKRIHYAGANNPLWVINPNRKIIPDCAKPFKEGGGFEIKANKQAIGYSEEISPFKTHTVELEKGDVLYTFSDGYPDQFGGEKGKKLKSANFRKMLFEIYDKSMDEQLAFLDSSFEEWRGNIEQVDDVCVIGVRL